MTRVNVIPPEFMFDEWVAAHCREGLRPVNKLRQGKYKSNPISGDYRLNYGHELWCAYHSTFTSLQWLRYKKEYHKRGFQGFDFDTYNSIHPMYANDYEATSKDYRHNLARLCERFRKRKKPYHFKGKVIDNNTDFLLWLYEVKDKLNLNKKGE